MYSEDKIGDLIGKTLATVEVGPDNDEIVFRTDAGETYRQYHSQDCCESVSIEDICGDLSDLIGSPIIEASEETSETNPPDIKKEYQDVFEWTFYKLGTAKGSVTIRWYGESNGYYSTSVSFAKLSG